METRRFASGEEAKHTRTLQFVRERVVQCMAINCGMALANEFWTFLADDTRLRSRDMCGYSPSQILFRNNSQGSR
jgi:hypothetical protein